jgi:DNA repair ATPase RecN
MHHHDLPDESLQESGAQVPAPAPVPAPEAEPPRPVDDQNPADRVSEILSTVESQLENLRAIQRSHDEQVVALTQREQELQKRLHALDERQEELGRQRGDLERERQTLAEEREQFVAELHEARAGAAR